MNVIEKADFLLVFCITEVLFQDNILRKGLFEIVDQLLSI